MKLPYRQIHLDFHTSPSVEDVGGQFNGEEFAKTLATAGVESVNLFAKCHHGYFYYPTKVGEMHPSLSADLLGGQVAACRAAGIRFNVYTCVGWNERASELHPQWMQRNRAGQSGNVEPFANYYYKWHSMCVGNKEYRGHLKDEIKEEIETFSPEGLWIDIITSFGCVCESCVADMKSRGLNPEREEDVRLHDRLIEIGFMEEIFSYIKSFSPDTKVFFNGAPADADAALDPGASNNRRRDFMDFVDIESLPGGYWGYSHFPICVNHLNYHDKPITMMNGRFHLSWGDFGSLRSEKALEYECFRGVASGAHVCVGDQMHPSGRLDASVYDRIGKVFKTIEALESVLENTQKCSEIGVYLSNTDLEPIGLPEEGVYRILTELKYQFDLIDCESEIDGYRLLILPDKVHLNETALQRLRRYIEHGGAVLMSCGPQCNMPELLPYFGIAKLESAEYEPRYLRITPDEFPTLPPMDTVFYDRGCEIEAEAPAKEIAKTTNPYYNRTWDRFCSHRQFPPALNTAGSGIIQNGNCIFIAQPIFGEYASYGNGLCRRLIQNLMGRLMTRPMIIADDLPTFAELYLRRQGEMLILHSLSYVVQKKSRDMFTVDDAVELYHKKIAVRCEKPPVSVTSLPENAAIPFTWGNGYTVMKPAKINGFDTFVICF